VAGFRELPVAAWEERVSRLPRWLKRVLLPVWNGGHHLAWRVGEYANAARVGRFERCSVCGRLAPILYRRWVIPPRLEELWGLSRRQAEALARKESCDCGFCGAKLRARRLASVLLATFPTGTPLALARSVTDWVRRPEAQALRVAELNLIEGLHQQLRRLPSLTYSEYRENADPGLVVDGVPSEDLTRLTYADASFDLVLSSETLEHVADFDCALRELHRVLASGGWHLFTVPMLPGVPATFARTIVTPDGTLEQRAPRICHPGGDVGYPVFTEFGADLPMILERAGFEVTVHFGPTTDDDLGQVYACRKKVAPSDDQVNWARRSSSPCISEQKRIV
jgi:SAM-dependent methyltransferase